MKKVLTPAQINSPEKAAWARIRTWRHHSHFKPPADLPWSQAKRQRLARQAAEHKALEKEFEDISPHEREIIRKLGFRVQQSLIAARAEGKLRNLPIKPERQPPTSAS